MIDREKVIKGLHNAWNYIDIQRRTYESVIRGQPVTCFNDVLDAISDALELLKAQEPITGETSDGYHTFNELYHHRAVLFSVIVSVFHDRAWKSKKHHDGTMFDGMFIVGIDTPDGQATYHYDIDPYLGMFNCRVLDNAPEWDGHTPSQAIERIGKLKAQEPIHAHWSFKGTAYGCSNCGHGAIIPGANYCEECGARMDEELPDGMLVKGIAPDKVDVVRCRDCKYGKLYLDADGHGLIQCTNTNYPAANIETWPLELDWYCAGGERRGENANN